MHVASSAFGLFGPPQASSLRGATAPRVVIDWADIALESEAQGHSVEMLLDWVRTSPHPGEIHVLLPRHSPAARRLQGSLQSLGCTVTSRHLGRRFAQTI